ncbi:MAG TPA: NAD-dependent protein deacylase [Lachnospiraceae bacterium]|jgi:NAD-dependent deacetylase|uniref:NAD-dependent protein deacetylase n=1 Tax=Butyrivibrio fibrisolvens TaxID=831 RepID=A0A317FXF2_BUTFI|nr:NAD-dependent protein deacylase [Butyrivibrio fibrisolvens]PWT26348.1 NAD-dependent protein deacylase [Butyrivibrio fibrisolvens]HAL02059.1 NAD-dependent protein deacylase [Lachnospiraceae bacterium]
MSDAVERLKELIESTDNIVFFGGAGVSTESGIPDFRSQDGLYNQKYKYPPEQIVSHTFLTKKPQEFFEFYKDRMIYQDAKPNKAHLKLAQWEKEGKLKAVITQNIDGLHQAAGSKNVLELHGSTLRNYCLKCGRRYDIDYVINSKETIPYCECGGMVRPDVVLYEEGLDMDVIESAVSYIKNADVLIIGGTSLAVYPAAGLIDYYTGDKLVVVNKSATPRDSQADLVVQGSIGEIFDQLP